MPQSIQTFGFLFPALELLKPAGGAPRLVGFGQKKPTEDVPDPVDHGFNARAGAEQLLEKEGHEYGFWIRDGRRGFVVRRDLVSPEPLSPASAIRLRVYVG